MKVKFSIISHYFKHLGGLFYPILIHINHKMNQVGAKMRITIVNWSNMWTVSMVGYRISGNPYIMPDIRKTRLLCRISGLYFFNDNQMKNLSSIE